VGFREFHTPGQFKIGEEPLSIGGGHTETVYNLVACHNRLQR
jgi:hypothetical protein